MIGKLDCMRWRCDLFLVSFVDVLFKKIIVPSGTAAEAARLNTAANEALDQVLEFGGILQNMDKHQMVPWMPSFKQNLLLFGGMIAGKIAVAARHLGWRFAFTSNEAELVIRLQAADMAWSQMHNFWFPNIYKKVKPLVFGCRVVGPLLTGLESHVLTRLEISRLEANSMRKLRTLTMGKACREPG